MNDESNGLDQLTEAIKEDRSLTPIDQVPFGLRVFKALQSAGGIKTLNDLSIWSEPELLKLRNLGRRGLNEVKEILAGYDLELRKATAEELKVSSQVAKPKRPKCAYRDHAFKCARSAMLSGDFCWSHERIRQGMKGSAPWSGGIYETGRWRNRILDTLKHDGQQLEVRRGELKGQLEMCEASLAEIDRLIGLISELPDKTVKPKRGGKQQGRGDKR